MFWTAMTGESILAVLNCNCTLSSFVFEVISATEGCAKDRVDHWVRMPVIHMQLVTIVIIRSACGETM